MSDAQLLNSQEYNLIDFQEGNFSFSSINQIFPNSQNTDSDVGEESKLIASLDRNGQLEMIKKLQQSSLDSGARPTSSEPALSDFEGILKFELQIGSLEQEKSNGTWFYSHDLKMVFMKVDTPITVLFSWNHSMMDSLHQLFIRATPVYTSPDFSKTPVLRCATHRASDPNQASNPVLIEHVLRAESKNSIYEKDERSGRFSAKVPVEALEPSSFTTENEKGKKNVKYQIKFVCQTSCPGGMERRRIHVIFTLENFKGDVYGRLVWGFKISACPKRDMQKDELDKKWCGDTTSCDDSKTLLIKKQSEKGAKKQGKKFNIKKQTGQGDGRKRANQGDTKSAEDEVDRCFLQLLDSLSSEQLLELKAQIAGRYHQFENDRDTEIRSKWLHLIQ